MSFIIGPVEQRELRCSSKSLLRLTRKAKVKGGGASARPPIATSQLEMKQQCVCGPGWTPRHLSFSWSMTLDHLKYYIIYYIILCEILIFLVWWGGGIFHTEPPAADSALVFEQLWSVNASSVPVLWLKKSKIINQSIRCVVKVRK